MVATHSPYIDLLIINPASRRRVYQALADELAAVEPPVWVRLMASHVAARGYRVEILDAEALGLAPTVVADHVAQLRPRLVAVVVYGHQPSASTQIMPAAGEVCSAIRELPQKFPVILLGGHVTALPERTLAEEAVDFVCGGEGPLTLVDLLEALATPCPDFSQVRDLVWRGPQGVCRGPAAPLLTDLDASLPGMPWDHLPIDRYRAHNWHCFGTSDRQPYAAVYTSLGCPYRCTFCCIQAPFKSGELALGRSPLANSYRTWSAEFVVDQLAILGERHGVRHVKVADEMFVLAPKRVEAICDLLIARKLDLNLWAYARIDTVAPRLLDKMRAAGFRWLALGIEAADSNVREEVHKGYDQELIHRVVGQIRAAGIHVIGNYIFGLPEDDLASMRRTLDLACDLNCEFGNFYSAMAYPGSGLYNRAIAEGWPLPASWSGYSQHSVDTLPLATRHVSSSQVLRFRDEAFHTYFESPRYLNMLGSTFGPGPVDEVRRMTATRLVRHQASIHEFGSSCATPEPSCAETLAVSALLRVNPAKQG